MLNEIIKIGILGPPNSGKTTFLIMQQFTERRGWNIRPQGSYARDLFNRGRKSFRQELNFIPPTPLDYDQIYLPFEFESPRNSIFQKRRTLQVLISECAGEFFELPYKTPEIIEEFSRGHGIIWLIDPVQIDNPTPDRKDYLELIQDWFGLLHEKQGGGRLKQYMAFCLTKMDLPEYVKYINQDAQTFCIDKLGDDFKVLLDDFCDPNKINFFATSAIGFLPGTKESNANENNRQLKSPAIPINLFASFDWLLSKV